MKMLIHMVGVYLHDSSLRSARAARKLEKQAFHPATCGDIHIL